jgi:hypothetical protein
MAGRQLRVDTEISEFPLEDALVFAARPLVMGFAHAVGALRDEDVRRAVFSDTLGPGLFAPWDVATIEVAGQPVDFHLLLDGEHWVAIAPVDPVVILLRGRTWDRHDIRLVPILDIAPYEG